MKPAEKIPNILHSEYEERPFCTCTSCGETLVDFQEGYQISKTFKDGECIFEYALCNVCRDKMTQEFSTESIQAIEKHYDNNIQTGKGLDACAGCSRPATDWSKPEYSVIGACYFDFLIDSLMVCAKCSEGVQSIMSQKTKDCRDRFIEENFPCAPNETSPLPGGVPIG